MAQADITDQHKRNFSMLMGPLIAYALLAGLYVGFMHGKWSWFSWHPIAMTVAFVAFAANAALIKKIGGYENTKMHGYLMSAACALGGFGWYVIYSNKEMFGKPHLYTLHGKLGAAVMVGYLSLGVFGALALHPDFGILKTNKTIRFAHKWGGRVLTALAWLACVAGKLNTNPSSLVIHF